MKKRLFKNIGFLTLSQIANYLLPLVTIPYVTRIVGPENFGIIEFAQATLLFFIVLVNYGFNRTATRRIAANENDMERVSYLFSSVMVAKAILFGLAFLVFGVLVLIVPKFSSNYVILMAGFPIVLGWGLYPVFLFEGLQKLSVTAVTDVLIKSLAAICILVFIKEVDDYYMVPMLNGIMQALFGLLALIYAIRKIEGLTFRQPKIMAVKAQLKEGQYIFYSSFFTAIYNVGTVFLGAFFLTPIQLGLYAAAYKLILVGNNFLFRPLLGALFPFLTTKFSEGLPTFKKNFKNAFVALAAVSFIASAVVYFLASFILSIVFGNEYLDAELALQIMAPTLFLGAFVHMFLQQGLLHLRKDKLYMTLVITGGILSLFLSLLLVMYYDVVGAALVRVIVDLYLVLLSGYFFMKNMKAQERKDISL